MIRIGVVGLGYWGPNLVRCFSELENAKVTAVCDRSVDRLLQIKNRYPSIHLFEDFEQLLATDILDALVIATPTSTHFQLASKAIERGLHVFVEKPLAQSAKECTRLIELADIHRVTLFVGHVFLHSAPIHCLKQLIDSGELGNINYISSRRLNLGPVRQDVSCLYDLAPHDISMMLYLLGESPETVACAGLACLNKGVQDVCNLTMNFSGNRMGMIHVSWLDPRKERVLTVVGDRKMAVYDDLEQEKIKVFDKGVKTPSHSSDYAEFQISYRYGGSYSPFLQEREPLKAECESFVEGVLGRKLPLTDGKNGLEVVEVLEAAEKSMQSGGGQISLKPGKRVVHS
jgi:predicted dehydrogenase